LSEPVFWIPRYAVRDGAPAASDEGQYLPGLINWVGRSLPSAYLAAAARRLGAELRSAKAGLRLVVGDAEIPLDEALLASLEPMLAPLGDTLPDEAILVVPATVTAQAEKLLRERLILLGVAEVRVERDAPALLRGAGIALAAGELALVTDVGLAETRVSLVRDRAVLAATAAPDLGLWDADQALADRLAAQILRAKGVDVAADVAANDLLLEQIANARRDTPPGTPWSIAVAGAELALEPSEIDGHLSPFSERVALFAGRLLEQYRPEGAPVAHLLLAGEEPCWPGLSAALGSLLGQTPVEIEVGPGARLRGATGGGV
jgi:hypothetical protein